MVSGGSGYTSPPNVIIAGNFGDYLEMKTVMVEDSAFPGTFSPILQISQGVWMQKDCFTNGFFGSDSPPNDTGGGAIMLGNRLTDMDDPPRITLTNSDAGSPPY